MNTRIAGSVGAVLSAGALVLVTSGVAMAESAPGSIPTTSYATTMDDELKVNRSVEICSSVLPSTPGVTVPTGTVTLTVTRGSKTISSETLTYLGTTSCTESGKLKKAGKYTATTVFTPTAGSEYAASTGSETFKVKGKKKK